MAESSFIYLLIGLVLFLLIIILLKVFTTRSKENLLEDLGFIKASLKNITRQNLLVQEIKEKVERGNVAQKDLQKRMEDTKELLGKFSADYQARLEEEKATHTAIKSIENILIGSRSKGMAGENIVKEALSVFPPEMIEKNFRIHNNPVEFALRLPNRKILPIDAKFTHLDLLENLEKEENEEKRLKIIRELNKAVVNKVKEIAKYIDPEITETHCIAAIPDSVFSVCSDAYYEAYKGGVILMSYSMTVPYLLTYLKLREQYTQSIDLENLHNCLIYVNKIIEDFNLMLEGYMSDALKRITKSFEDSKRYVHDLSRALSKLKVEEKTGFLG